MNKYEMIYNELCDRVESGELSLEDAESINDVAYDRYVTERRLTPVDRHLYKFKKKYNFVPDKDDRNRGTITVDGKDYPVELDINSKTMVTDDGQTVPRQTAHEITSKKGTIHLDKNNFRMNSKRSDAMLQHEIGHAKMHNFHPESKLRMRNAAHPDIVNTHAGTVSNITYYGVNSPFIQRQKHQLRKAINDEYDTPEYRSKARSAGKDQYNSRQKMFNHMRQYDGTISLHQNPLEYEADRYAANHANHGSQSNGASQVKRALRQVYKYARQDADKQLKDYSPHNRKAIAAVNNKVSSNDYNARSKALNDQVIANYPLYK